MLRCCTAAWRGCARPRRASKPAPTVQPACACAAAHAARAARARSVVHLFVRYEALGASATVLGAALGYYFVAAVTVFGIVLPLVMAFVWAAFLWLFAGVTDRNPSS